MMLVNGVRRWCAIRAAVPSAIRSACGGRAARCPAKAPASAEPAATPVHSHTLGHAREVSIRLSAPCHPRDRPAGASVQPLTPCSALGVPLLGLGGAAPHCTPLTPLRDMTALRLSG